MGKAKRFMKWLKKKIFGKKSGASSKKIKIKKKARKAKKNFRSWRKRAKNVKNIKRHSSSPSVMVKEEPALLKSCDILGFPTTADRESYLSTSQSHDFSPEPALSSNKAFYSPVENENLRAKKVKNTKRHSSSPSVVIKEEPALLKSCDILGFPTTADRESYLSTSQSHDFSPEPALSSNKAFFSPVENDNRNANARLPSLPSLAVTISKCGNLAFEIKVHDEGPLRRQKSRPSLSNTKQKPQDRRVDAEKNHQSFLKERQKRARREVQKGIEARMRKSEGI